MIEMTYQRGLLNTTQLVDLFSDPHRIDPRGREYNGKQYRTIAQRLRKMQNHKLISTLEAQKRAFLHDFENDSKVYVIADKAVPILEEMGYIVPQTNYTEAAGKRQSYQHDLNVSEIFTRYVTASREKNVPYHSYKQLIEEAHLQALEKYPYKPKKWELFRYTTEHGTLIPDDLFTLTTKKKRLFFLEVDRNTEPNISSQRKKTVKNTLDKYISLYWNKKHVESYGVDRFRVLFVTKSQAHIANVAKLLDTFDKEIFLFSTYQEIKACKNILDLAWRTNKGSVRRIA
jgi:protein involved in plasmid replication-relaxation